MKSFELGKFAKQCIAKMSIRNIMKHLDKMLFAAMEFDVLKVKVSRMGNSPILFF